MKRWFLFSAGLATACAARTQTDEFEGYPTNCSQTVLEELGAEDVSTILGVSARDVARDMTAIASGPATILEHAEQVSLELTTTADVVDSAVRVVELSGSGACLQGQFLEADVQLVTSGTIDGWAVEAEDFTTIYASGPGFDAVWLAELEDHSVGANAEVPTELADYFRSIVENEALSGDPATWSWALGPAVGVQQPWRDAVSQSHLSVFASEAGVDYNVTLVQYAAVDDIGDR